MGGFGVGVGVGILTILILMRIGILLFPVKLRPEGHTTYTFSGKYCALTWDQITSVGTMSVVGLRYITFQTNDNKTLYIPCFLTDFIGFRDQVAAWAGEHQVLTQALFSL